MKPSLDHLNLIKSKWNLKGQLKLVRKVENWIYRSDDGDLFFRVTQPTHRSIEQLQSELQWMFFLKEQGVHFAHPLKSNNLNLIETIEVDKDIFFVSAFARAKGIPLINEADFSEIRMQNWGKIIGDLHRVSQGHKVPSSTSKRPEWNEEGNHRITMNFCHNENEFHERFTQLRNWMQSLEKNKNSYGLIHADLHHGNFFVDKNDKLTIFDFDDCHYNWFLYDLAVPIFTLSISLRKSHKEKIDELINWFVKGYHKSGVLNENWLKKLPAFILYRHFTIYFWGVKNINHQELTPEAREWIKMAIEYCRNFIDRYDLNTL